MFLSLVRDGQSYWSYGFPAAIIVASGASFVYSTGALFIANCALPHEQSVAGALFTVMTQVSVQIHLGPLSPSYLVSFPCRDGAWVNLFV